ncbi:aminotransferase class V-fold PLP-dependent enzyme [Nannocystaceae bacterium ST9]
MPLTSFMSATRSTPAEHAVALPRRAILLAGGSGTRLSPITRIINKHLLPVYDRPMIYYPLATLIAGGASEILLVSSARDLVQFEALLGAGEQFGVSIRYCEQSEPRGIADAFRLGAEFVGDQPVSLILGDNIFDHGIVDHRAATREYAGRAMAFAKAVDEPSHYGVVEFDEAERVLDLVEKPRSPRSRWAVTGLYVYGPEVVSVAAALRPSARGELEITDLNRVYLERGGFELTRLGRDRFWCDAGTPGDLAAATAVIAERVRRGDASLGCPVGAALERGLIDRLQVARLAELDAGSSYGAHLASLVAPAPSEPPSELPKVLLSPERVPLHDGRRVRVVPLNNAATTPPLVETVTLLREFLANYGALHRGAGPRARMTVETVENSIATIRRFIGCPDSHALVFAENTSAAINLLARTLALGPDDVVALSDIEHTSNNLPWRYNTAAKVVEFASTRHGDIDFEVLERVVAEHGARLRVIAVSGASNQTGHVPDLARIAALARRHGALFFVDGAQLVPHRQVDMQATGIGALAFSAHKVYAPFGLGVLALPAELLDVTPVNPGGGSIDMISEGGVIWSPASERHQTGTWNVTGIVALAASCAALERAGWPAIYRHERALMQAAVEQLGSVPGLISHVPLQHYLDQDRIGAFPFSLPPHHHALLAAALEHEHGIEVRSGTICNHRLVRRWFGVDDDRQGEIEAMLARGDRLASYGIVRASVGIHNTVEDIERLGAALRELAEHGPRLRYQPKPGQETFEPA